MEFSWTFLVKIAIVHCLLALEATTCNNDTDHLALLEFKARITLDPFRVLSSWNGSTHFCNWRGVSCSHRHHQRVTVLDLSHSKLSGSIAPHIGNLSFLKEVYLRNNSFTSQIPPEIGKLTRLQQFVVHSNALHGSIPANMSSCTQLVQFSASNNKLVGDIPKELSSLSKLQFLFLGTNNLTGNIPSSFGNLSSLEELLIFKNNLIGILPDGLGQLTNLNLIALAANRLEGTVPPSIFNRSSIKILDLGANQIHGTLPSNLGNTLPNLNVFSIAFNQFTGSIPISVSNASNLEVFQVNENKLNGKVPSLEKMHMLQVFRLTSNHFGNGGAEDDGDLIFLCSLANATNLLSLDINANNFGGTLPECISNLSTTLKTLVVNSNKISGGIPIGIGNLVSLERLHMWNNQLTGDIPPEIGNLQKMQDLALTDNKLSGTIPSSLGNLKLLIRLALQHNNIQGSIPSNLSQCQNLISLSLSDNNLSGSIPPGVMGIQSLSIGLSLRGNQLSGALPMEVANLNNIGILDVSDNLLSGEIPSVLGSCIKLETLSLGGNFFQGDIPSSLSSLRGLKELNFSHNKLSGQVPKFLASLSSLQSLDLSYNKLEGVVPTQGVFKNASATFVVGNNELCGGVQELKLPRCKSEKSSLPLALILVITLVSMLAAILLLLSVMLPVMLLCCFKKKRTVYSSTDSSTQLLAKVFHQDLLLATDNFSSANIIGMGSFGTVYKGVFQQFETTVAVKVLNLSHPGALKSFLVECEALRNIRHRNLVRVINACSIIDNSGKNFKALVYEFMVNGSLDEWLHHDSGITNATQVPKKLSFLQRLNIVIDVGSALDYLHHNHHQSPIVHCDLKPSNVLLDAEMTGHVGDFGLARFLQDMKKKETSSSAIKGTIGYAPPEYGMGSELSTRGDVYSYGILLLEVFTGKRPTDDMFQDSLNLRTFVKEGLPDRVMEISDPILLEAETNPEFVDCLGSIFEVGVICCLELPRRRPSVNDALTLLVSLRDNFVALQLSTKEV